MNEYCDNKKILVFTPFYPPSFGGLQNHAEEFNFHLAKKGFTITVFTPKIPRESKEFDLKNGIKIIRFPVFNLIPHYPVPCFWSVRFWKMFISLFGDDFDIIISRMRFFSTSLLALTYSKIKKVKWVHVEHGSDFIKLNNKFNKFLARIYDQTLGRLVLKLSDVNIANSKATALFVKKLVKNKKCTVIYRGIEREHIEGIKPNTKLKNKFPNDILISFIGRLIDGKGVDDLLRVAKLLSVNRVKYFIIGDGSQRKNLEKLAKSLGIEDRVIFFGHKNHDETLGILKICDIVVNPSYTEGLPTVVIEAALCKKPIIATSVGGTGEIIRNTVSGITVNPGNVNQMAEEIRKLASNKELRIKLGNEAYSSVKKFNWNDSIRKYIEIFRPKRVK